MNKPVLLVGGVSLSKSFPTKLRDTSLLVCWFGVNVEQTPVRCSEVGREQRTNSSSMAQRSRRSRKTAHDFHRGLDACFRGQPCPCWTGPTFEEVAFRPRSGVPKKSVATRSLLSERNGVPLNHKGNGQRATPPRGKVNSLSGVPEFLASGPSGGNFSCRKSLEPFCAKFRMPASCPCPRAGLIREQSSFKQSSAEFICRRLQQATVQDGISQ